MLVHHGASAKIVSFDRWKAGDEQELKQHMGIKLAHLPPQEFTADKTALLMVEDNGRGIPANIQEGIFAQFYHQVIWYGPRFGDVQNHGGKCGWEDGF